ncbi:MAG: beta-ketoacyl synthase chain length factor [Bacteroidales bacterium]|nr:beta-ketoacyl synthase chain length factor [Bacteroidales bacterium]
MEAFINGISAISPQKTFPGGGLWKEVTEYNNVQYLKCIESRYNDYLDPMAARRMSRIVKMGVCAATECLHMAGVESPDAIITGTGLGCIEDTEKFLTSIYANEETLLNPTPFIQSTHNTVAAGIALKFKCNHYNNTYVHRGFSFENALLDGLMLLHEGAADNILVGGLDELTEKSFIITYRLGLWKRKSINSLTLLDHKTRGSLAGEGTAFFVLSRKKKENTLARIHTPGTIYKPGNTAEVEAALSGFIQRNVGNISDVDLVIMGLNGDPLQDEVYYQLKTNLFHPIACTYYKHLCGEYDTSSSFALYLAAMILKEQQVPEAMRLDNKPPGKIRNVLVYNHLRNKNHAMFLLSSC